MTHWVYIANPDPILCCQIPYIDLSTLIGVRKCTVCEKETNKPVGTDKIT